MARSTSMVRTKKRSITDPDAHRSSNLWREDREKLYDFYPHWVCCTDTGRLSASVFLRSAQRRKKRRGAGASSSLQVEEVQDAEIGEEEARDLMTNKSQAQMRVVGADTE